MNRVQILPLRLQMGIERKKDTVSPKNSAGRWPSGTVGSGTHSTLSCGRLWFVNVGVREAHNFTSELRLIERLRKY